MANDCIGEEVQKLAASLPDGGVLLLENVRFYKEEEKNDPVKGSWPKKGGLNWDFFEFLTSP